MANKKTFQQLMVQHRYHDALALGFVAGVEPDVKFGHIPVVTSGVRTDVWEYGATQPIYLFPPDAGDSIEVYSSSAADTGEITIKGLNPAGLQQVETITLSGVAGVAGVVAVPGLWRAINRAYNGNGVDLAGQVFIRKVGDAARVYGLVDIDDQQTSQTPYVVPAGKVALINNFSTAVNKSGGASTGGIFAFRVRLPGKVFRTQIRYGLQREGTSNISSDLVVPMLIAPLSQVKVTVKTDGAGADISAEYSMWLIDADLLPPELLADIS